MSYYFIFVIFQLNGSLICGQYIFDTSRILPPQSFWLLNINTGLFEEILFRGIILTLLLAHYSEKKSVMISAVIFGVIHYANLLLEFNYECLILQLLKLYGRLVCDYFGEPLNEAIEIMHNKAFSQVPIIQGTLILGTVTESSIISKSQGKDVSALTVNDVMVDTLPILPPDTRNEEIYTLLKYHSAILVVSKGMLLGIVTKADIMHHLLERKVI